MDGWMDAVHWLYIEAISHKQECIMEKNQKTIPENYSCWIKRIISMI